MNNATLTAACRAMIPDEPGGPCAPANVLLRRTDTGPETVTLAATLFVAFDVNTPPN